MGNVCLEGGKKSIFVKFDDDELKYENQQTSRMSADSSMGAHTSNMIDAQNDINDAAWNPVGDSPLIAPVSATMEVPPIEEIRPVEPAEPVQPAQAEQEQEQANPVQAEQAEPEQAPTEQQTLAAVQEVLSTSISNLKVEIPESSSETDDDMPPLISSSDEESESDSKESDDSKEDSESDSKEESDDSKEDSESDSKEESDDSKEESKEESDDSEDEDLMVAVFPRPTCPRCDAALKALLTPSEDESETESSGSDSARVHRIRPKPTEIPTIILTLFKILLFLHIVQFLTTSIAPARRTYS